jgi:hypothetical protein
MSKGLKATTRRIPMMPDHLLERKLADKITYELKSRRQEKFTMELASKFIEMETFVGERPLKDDHVAFLYREAKAGRFLHDLANLASCLCKWDGVERRLNGQHTSWMRTFMPKRWCPPITVLRFAVDREEDYRSLYASFDRNSPRSNREVVGAECKGTEKFEAVPSPLLFPLASGLRLWTASGKRDRRPIDEIVDLMKSQFYNLTLNVSAFMSTMSPSTAPHMYRRAPVTGAMFATFNKSQAEATRFWTLVRDGGGSAGFPPLVLMKWLTKTAMNAAKDTRSRQNVGREEMYCSCITAWNAFRRGQTMKIMRVCENRPGVH